MLDAAGPLAFFDTGLSVREPLNTTGSSLSPLHQKNDSLECKTQFGIGTHKSCVHEYRYTMKHAHTNNEAPGCSITYRSIGRRTPIVCTRKVFMEACRQGITTLFHQVQIQSPTSVKQRPSKNHELIQTTKPSTP